MSVLGYLGRICNDDNTGTTITTNVRVNTIIYINQLQDMFPVALPPGTVAEGLG